VCSCLDKNEETGENDVIGEDDKAVDNEVWWDFQNEETGENDETCVDVKADHKEVKEGLMKFFK
jgi:hypothetical protein